MVSWLGLLGLTVVVSAIILPRQALADIEKRVALVIGNGDYATAPRLDNPPIDAKAVAAALRRLGFDVVDGYDLPIAQMRSKIAEFSAELPDAKVALVYYAGHGVSADEENYMLPTDIVLKSPSDLDINAISISLVLKQMKREERVNVVILDACRDNPFAAEMAHSRTRAVIGERGLSAIDGDLARGTLIAFASDPKSTALDGKPGQNSPFTRALLDHLEDPGVPFDTVMSRVRTEVWASTRQKQLPWVNTSLIGEFSLTPRAATSDAVASSEVMSTTSSERSVAPDTRLAQENMLWESAQHSNLASDYSAYLDAYPSGVYAKMARNRIASLAPAPAAGSSTEPASATPGPAAAKAASAEAPAAVAPAALKGEVGTMATEKGLGLTREQRRQIQQRLAVMDFDVGPVNGEFGEKTRAALADWQTRHQVTPTSWLGPLQFSVLKAESESQYQRFLNAQAMTPAVVVTRAIQPVRRLPVRRAYVQVRRRLRVYGAPDNGSAAIGSFFGGVASGLIGRLVNH